MPRLRWVDGKIVEEPLHIETARQSDRRLVDASADLPCSFGAHRVNPRSTRDSLERQLIDITDGSPAAREWAASKANAAASSWDRGVESGSIPKHT